MPTVHRFTAAPIAAAAAACCAAACFAPSAFAQSAGKMLIKVGVNHIRPSVSSGALSAPALPDTRFDMGPATSLMVSAAYMWTQTISTEFIIGLPYAHDVLGAGSAAGTGVVGKIKQISPTLLAQYRFGHGNNILRPYVGVGPTVMHIYESEGSSALTSITNPGGGATTLTMKSALGLTGQIGASFAFNHKWFVDASVMKTYLKTTTELSSKQTMDTTLNPLAINFSAGYRF